jgi:hypothetical protein
MHILSDIRSISCYFRFYGPISNIGSGSYFQWLHLQQLSGQAAIRIDVVSVGGILDETSISWLGTGLLAPYCGVAGSNIW